MTETEVIHALMYHCTHLVNDFLAANEPENLTDRADCLQKFVQFQQDKLPEHLARIRKDGI